MDSKIRTENKIPGSEVFTRPDEIKALSRYLGKIKKTQEDHTKLGEDSLELFGRNSGLIPKIESLEDFRDDLQHLTNLNLYTEPDRLLDDQNPVSLALIKEKLNLVENQNNEISGLEDKSEPLNSNLHEDIDKLPNAVISGSATDLRIALQDQLIRLKDGREIQLDNTIEKIEDRPVRNLSDKVDPLKNAQEKIHSLPTDIDNLTDESKVTKLGNTVEKLNQQEKVSRLDTTIDTLKDDRKIELPIELDKLSVESEIELSNSVDKLNLSEQIKSLSTKKVEIVTGDDLVDSLPDTVELIRENTDIKLENHKEILNGNDLVDSLVDYREDLFNQKELLSLSNTREDILTNKGGDVQELVNSSEPLFGDLKEIVNLGTYKELTPINEHETRIELVINSVDKVNSNLKDVNLVGNSEPSLINKGGEITELEKFKLEIKKADENLSLSKIIDRAPFEEKVTDLEETVLNLREENLVENLDNTVIDLLDKGSVEELEEYKSKVPVTKQESTKTFEDTIVPLETNKNDEVDYLDLKLNKDVMSVEDTDTYQKKILKELEDSANLSDVELFNRVIHLAQRVGDKKLKEGDRTTFEWLERLSSLVSFYLSEDNIPLETEKKYRNELEFSKYIKKFISKDEDGEFILVDALIDNLKSLKNRVVKNTDILMSHEVNETIVDTVQELNNYTKPELLHSKLDANRDRIELIEEFDDIKEDGNLNDVQNYLKRHADKDKGYANILHNEDEKLRAETLAEARRTIDNISELQEIFEINKDVLDKDYRFYRSNLHKKIRRRTGNDLGEVENTDDNVDKTLPETLEELTNFLDIRYKKFDIQQTLNLDPHILNREQKLKQVWTVDQSYTTFLPPSEQTKSPFIPNDYAKPAKQEALQYLLNGYSIGGKNLPRVQLWGQPISALNNKVGATIRKKIVSGYNSVKRGLLEEALADILDAEYKDELSLGNNNSKILLPGDELAGTWLGAFKSNGGNLESAEGLLNGFNGMVNKAINTMKTEVNNMLGINQSAILSYGVRNRPRISRLESKLSNRVILDQEFFEKTTRTEANYTQQDLTVTFSRSDVKGKLEDEITDAKGKAEKEKDPFKKVKLKDRVNQLLTKYKNFTQDLNNEYGDLVASFKSIGRWVNSYAQRYIKTRGMDITLSKLCNYSGVKPKTLDQLKDILKKSEFISTPAKYSRTSEKNNTQTLSSNSYWEVILEPFCHFNMNGGFSFLPSFREINTMNMVNHGVNTGYNRWIPIINFELNKAKLTTKSLGLYDGEINYPISTEEINELRITMLNDAYKSWSGYWRKVMEVSTYNSEPHIAAYYSEKYPTPTAIDKTSVCTALYKNVTFRCRIFILSPQYSTIREFDLLCVLKEFSESYVGEVDSPGGDVNLVFSIVGENPGAEHAPILYNTDTIKYDESVSEELEKIKVEEKEFINEEISEDVEIVKMPPVKTRDEEADPEAEECNGGYLETWMLEDIYESEENPDVEDWELDAGYTSPVMTSNGMSIYDYENSIGFGQDVVQYKEYKDITSGMENWESKNILVDKGMDPHPLDREGELDKQYVKYVVENPPNTELVGKSTKYL